MDNDIENSQALSTTTIPIHPDEAWQKRDEANKKKRHQVNYTQQPTTTTKMKQKNKRKPMVSR